MNESTGRIVVGVDGSAGGLAAFRHALAEAARRGAVVEVVTVGEDAGPWAGVLGGPPLGAPDALPRVLHELLHDRTANAVRDVLAERPGPWPPVTVRVAEGDPATTLLDAATGADLLVIGTHRRGSLAGMLLGAVGRRCVLHAPCPVTVVHAPHPHTPPSARAPAADRAGTLGR